MGGKLGLGEKEISFLTKWTDIRKGGRVRYITTRGSLLGLILFAIWLVITIIEINISDFEKAVFTWDSFVRQCITWFVCEFIIGFIIANQSWKSREEKFHYLS
ncbi:hypothetical protein [Paenibacillus chungangensis]